MVRPRPRKPTIILAMDMREWVMPFLVAEAKARDWQFINLLYTGNVLPTSAECDGAIVRDLASTPLVKRLQRMGCPTVRVGIGPHPQDRRLPVVFPDMKAAGALAADHFAERGFLHVGYIGQKPLGGSRALYEGLRARAGERQMAVHLLQLAPLNTTKSRQQRYDKREQQIREWLGALPKPVGILGYNQALAGRVCCLCQALGLAVPERVGLIANVNRVVECETAPVGLSAVDTNLGDVAREAADLLASLMRGEDEFPCRIAVPPKGVIERQSTSVLAVPDPAVARAIRFIWDNLDQPISVDDIARATSVSRSKLERGFRRCLKRGINAELRRKRLERFADLLRQTDKTIPELAAATGFRSRAYLHRIFRETHGQTPRQYRLAMRRVDPIGA